MASPARRFIIPQPLLCQSLWLIELCRCLVPSGYFCQDAKSCGCGAATSGLRTLFILPPALFSFSAPLLLPSRPFCYKGWGKKCCTSSLLTARSRLIVVPRLKKLKQGRFLRCRSYKRLYCSCISWLEIQVLKAAPFSPSDPPLSTPSLCTFTHRLRVWVELLYASFMWLERRRNVELHLLKHTEDIYNEIFFYVNDNLRDHHS